MKERLFNRQSNRLSGFDYSNPGMYYITICCACRHDLFGEVKNRTMHLNQSGEIVKEEWIRMISVRNTVKLDEYIIMPNHLHGIINIVSADETHTIIHRVDDLDRVTHRVAPTGPKSGSIGAIICQFKSITTKRINLLLETKGTAIWQRNYYDHIIRSDEELERIREYIRTNPARWFAGNDSAISLHNYLSP